MVVYNSLWRIIKVFTNFVSCPIHLQLVSIQENWILYIQQTPAAVSMLFLSPVDTATKNLSSFSYSK